MDSLYFTMLNHNKHSITLNTKTARGRAIFTRLVEECDVLVENFAPGALDRMGFTWERIQEINPRLVYASVKGFGPGPYQECKVYEAVSARVAARGAWRKLLRTSPTTSCPSNPSASGCCRPIPRSDRVSSCFLLCPLDDVRSMTASFTVGDYGSAYR